MFDNLAILSLASAGAGNTLCVRGRNGIQRAAMLALLAVLLQGYCISSASTARGGGEIAEVLAVAVVGGRTFPERTNLKARADLGASSGTSGPNPRMKSGRLSTRVGMAGGTSDRSVGRPGSERASDEYQPKLPLGVRQVVVEERGVVIGVRANEDLVGGQPSPAGTVSVGRFTVALFDFWVTETALAVGDGGREVLARATDLCLGWAANTDAGLTTAVMEPWRRRVKEHFVVNLEWW
ncbi:hypothetical protein EDB83DRAFT_2551699 [Lactarius deliciosus]|nr:hypothetical protein EDB83DRAFT_2551699 [Lactarius deliciosus]